jgi:hypothetical protein
MALLNLESLVLRGSVRCDVLALNLRLGTSAVAGSRISPTDPCLPPLSLGYRPMQPFGWPIFGGNPGPEPVDNPEAGAQPGAGRSRRHAGFSSHRTKPTALHTKDTPQTSWFTTAARRGKTES